MGRIAVCAVIALWIAPATAAERPRLECNRETACELQLYLENDSLGAGTDRYYTNGIKLGGGINADRVVDRLFQGPAKSVLERISSHWVRGTPAFFPGRTFIRHSASLSPSRNPLTGRGRRGFTLAVSRRAYSEIGCRRSNSTSA